MLLYLSLAPHLDLGFQAAVMGIFSAVAERALAGKNNVSLVRTSWAGPIAASVDRGAEKVHARVHAGRVNVVVFGEVTHFGAVYCGSWCVFLGVYVGVCGGGKKCGNVEVDGG